MNFESCAVLFLIGTKDSRLAMQVDLESMIALSDSIAVDMEEATNSRHPTISSSSTSEKPVTLSGAKRRPATELEPRATPGTKKKCAATDRVARKAHRPSLGGALPVENLPQSCTKCKEYELRLHSLEAKLAICQSDLEDACLAKAAKFAMIQDLRAQLREAKAELEWKTALLEKTAEKNLSLTAMLSRENSRQGGMCCPLPGICVADNVILMSQDVNATSDCFLLGKHARIEWTSSAV